MNKETSRRAIDASLVSTTSSFLLLNFHVFRLYSDRTYAPFSHFSRPFFFASPPPLACKFRLSRFCNVDVRIGNTYARTRSLDRRRQRYSREPRTKREFPSRSSIQRINMEIPKRLTNERIASTQNLRGTLATARRLYQRGARVARRSSSRIGVAAPRRSSTFYFLAPASASDLL